MVMVTVNGDVHLDLGEIPTTYLEDTLSGPSRLRLGWRNEQWVQALGRDAELDSIFDDEASQDAFKDWLSSDEDNGVFRVEFARQPYNLVKAFITRRGNGAEPPDDRIHIITSSPLASRYESPSSRSRPKSLVVPTHPPSPSTPTPTPRSETTRESPTSDMIIPPEPSISPLEPGTPASPLIDCKTLLERTDWTSTKMGPREQWSPVIETMLEVIMRSPTQDALWLGEDFQMLYNDNYAHIVDHPMMYGRSAKVKEAWGPVWDSVYHLIQRCLEEGEPCYREDDLLLYRRGPSGYWVEKYHTWSFIPLFDEQGRPLGLFNPTRETTPSVLARRRQESMRDLSENLLIARTLKEYYTSIVEVLEKNPKDVPFLLCYSVEGDAEEHNRGLHQLNLTLESTIGVPEDHPAAPRKLNLTIGNERSTMRASYGKQVAALSSPTLSAISALSSGTGRVNYSYDKHSWPILKAITSRQAVVIDDCTELIRGFPLRQWEALPEAAIIIPICSETSTETPHAVMILGLNLASPLDPVYEDWIHVLRAHLTSSLGSVRAYEAEHQRQLERDRMERAKTAWFQGAAHDLRSPLTLVAGPLDDTLRTALTPEQRSALSLAQRNLARVQRLVNALLDFSRIEAGKMTGRFLPVDLGRFVGELAALFKPAVERRKLTYRVSIEPHEGMVFVDPTLFETVVTNLISNALKYTQKGSVDVIVKYHEQYVDIAIVDTGIGIPKAELSAVTDRFHRATTALTSGTEGTGIGLALTKEIIRLHGGDLLITSQTPAESGGSTHGSSFTARIPLIERQVMEENEHGRNTNFGAYGKQVVEEAMHWMVGGSSDIETESNGSGLEGSLGSRGESFLFDRSDLLLLVDDNTDMRHYVKRIFSPYCKVIEAANGQQALEKARANPPDLILSDLMMPVMNGHQLLNAIRSDPATRMVPMVLLSAATDDELRLGALIEGAEDFMLKPFKPKELLARVHLHMQIGKKRALLEALYAQRERELAILSDFCPAGIIRSDADGTIIYGNDTYRAYTGIPAGVDLNRWPDYVDAETREVLLVAWNEVLYGNKRETTRTWKWLNGTTTSGTFIRLDMVDSGLSGVMGCLSDISYQEERLLEAERRRIEAEESKQQQELLVDLTSHEIRTPVSAILQCSSLVKENLVVLQENLRGAGVDGFRAEPRLLTELEEDIEALESIYQCGLVQERIANDVLSLARIQLDMLTMHDFEMDLKKEARKIVSVFAPEAKMKKIDLELEFGENIQRTGTTVLKTDHVRLQQIVTNLISNAIRFTATSATRVITVQYEVSFVPPADNTCAPPTEREAVLELPVKEDTPVWLFIAVRDTGPGLGPAEQAALFQRFSQGNKMIHTKYGGSGLGLFICKRISELLGGRIEMTSQLGVGSVFRFFIKSRTAAPPAVPQTLEQSTAALTLSTPSSTLSPARVAVPEPSTSDLHLLVVEDNIINQTVLKRQIIKNGLTCDVANHGQEALDLLYHQRASGDQRPYDAILMDLEMPVMDGLTAVKHIRQSENNGSLDRQLVIALTGNARQGQIDQALAAGMDDVVIKPYKLKDLLAKLRNEVEQRKLNM
ncbi:hypothetical protein I316_06002 [Kwoniella heveanensis BCC8398]|uniref:Two-component system sensor protein n=1 Tax=Kwoniella heveanensis BCC8398 TaxID=1296120 RepID=A0A1B9GMH7_9TREE|nr:hypothetical protein I316_06002 [Kwoniella heveanensis BCC8398]